MKIELFYSPGCTRCDAARAGLKTAVADTLIGLPWHWVELNVLEHLDAAVALGILTLPALAVDGKLVFTSLPTPAQLSRELLQRRRSSP